MFLFENPNFYAVVFLMGLILLLFFKVMDASDRLKASRMHIFFKGVLLTGAGPLLAIASIGLMLMLAWTAEQVARDVDAHDPFHLKQEASHFLQGEWEPAAEVSVPDRSIYRRPEENRRKFPAEYLSMPPEEPQR